MYDKDIFRKHHGNIWACIFKEHHGKFEHVFLGSIIVTFELVIKDPTPAPAEGGGNATSIEPRNNVQDVLKLFNDLIQSGKLNLTDLENAPLKIPPQSPDGKGPAVIGKTHLHKV